MKIFYILIFALFTSNIVNAQWMSQNSNTTDTLDCVFFTDAYTGYALGAIQDIGNVNHILLKTYDGGLTWEDLNFNHFGFSVHFTNALTGYVCGIDTIFKTTDGGTSWSDYPLGMGDLYLFDIHFFNSAVGYATAMDINTEQNFVLHTNNAGSTWTSVSGGTCANLGSNAIFCTSANTCYVVGFNGNHGLYKTTDGGHIWNCINNLTNPSMDCASIFFTNSNTAFATSGNYIYKTTDGGYTWSQNYNDPINGLGAIYFTNEFTGFVVGENGTVIWTTDEGMNWYPMESPTTKGLRNIFFPTENRGYAVGETGTIIKYSRDLYQIHTVLIGDSIELNVTNANGMVQWQESNNAVTWTDIPGLTNNTESIIVSSSPTGRKYYRPEITNTAVCNPSPWYGSIIYIKIISNTSQLQLGEYFHGGIIFSTDGAGNGTVAQRQDQSMSIDFKQWGCKGNSISAAQSTTDGASNTTAIINACNDVPIAASICDTNNSNGFSDWFLPAKDQLNLMYQQKELIGNMSTYYYWSSTESSADNSWLQLFGGVDQGYQGEYPKDYGASVTCIRSYSHAFEKAICYSLANEPYNVFQDENICLVTVDTNTWKNKIMWEKTPDVGTASYNIYKEVSANVYSLAGSTLYSDPGSFIDISSTPESHGDKYKITAIDTCGSESTKSTYHKTMNLVISTFGSTMGLSWTPYVDESGSFVPDKYYIFKGTLTNNMQILDSISSSFTSYNDNNVLSTYYYIVGVKKPNACSFNKSSSPMSFSNPKQGTLGINDINLNATIFISPNPMTTFATLEVPNFSNQSSVISSQLTITDVTGKVVREISSEEMTNLQINSSSNLQIKIERGDLKPGIYFVELKADRTYRGKLIVE